jgi:hypothetical protein
VIRVAEVDKRVRRLENLTRGLSQEVALWKKGPDPLQCLERQAVLLRKTSGGTDSAAGSRFVERLLTVVATCKRQGRNVRDYLHARIKAWQHDLAPPSLRPDTS